ncbi:MAG: ATP-dependent DNA helicase RecG [bacterium]|nr:ATP-dependent DNA helicase RecG [bacterium]
MLTKSPALATKLSRLGIHCVEDLLYYLPYRYDDFTRVVPIKDLVGGETVAVEGVIERIQSVRAWRRQMQLIEMVLRDGTGSIRIVWFNQFYLLKAFHKNMSIAVAGKVYANKKGLYFANPAYETLTDNQQPLRPITEAANRNEAIHTRRLVPVYRETRGITSRAIRILVARHLPAAARMSDALPLFVREREGFLPLMEALRAAHFPANAQEAEEARRRFRFEELFIHQVRMLQLRRIRARQSAHAVPFDQSLVKSFVDGLPFTLTDDQRKAAWHILQDIAKPYPMQRLLEGDVGSGKTIVAFLAAYETAKAGYQALIMAPTEVLARQHFAGARRLLSSRNISVGLATASEHRIFIRQGGVAVEKKISAKLFSARAASGEIQVIIGTHALISGKIAYNDLALAVVDEQHRFGVDQRAALLKKSGDGVAPHFLSMSATPIPRTLALAVYGDLDLSRIITKPAGRQHIETRIIPPHKRNEAYAFMRSQAQEGRQVFVICPRIESSETGEARVAAIGAPERGKSSAWSDVKAVKDEYEKLSKSIFPDLKIAMLHGRMKPKEKEAVMEKFIAHEYDLLVSTSVIEVGIDVPNATVIAIEGADRFGLAQLHQFRGRVGRGEHKSYCLLLSDSAAAATASRLKALTEAKDGFALAEIDLDLRGPGELLGGEQSGMPDIAMEALRNPALIEAAREAASQTLAKDPNLAIFPSLQDRVGKLGERLHAE